MYDNDNFFWNMFYFLINLRKQRKLKWVVYENNIYLLKLNIRDTSTSDWCFVLETYVYAICYSKFYRSYDKFILRFIYFLCCY